MGDTPTSPDRQPLERAGHGPEATGPDETSQGSARARSLRRTVIGVAIFVPGLLLFLVARSWLLATFGTTEGNSVVVRIPTVVAMAIGAPMTVGYWLLVSGIYGVVFGARGRALTPLWSLFRIAFGLVVTLGMIAIALVVFVRSSTERSHPPTEPTELVAPPG
ncbi:MAG: hypothetical protein U0183_24650 [Polyangiaceae bacterium]